jgi:hypothetical protein
MLASRLAALTSQRMPLSFSSWTSAPFPDVYAVHAPQPARPYRLRRGALTTRAASRSMRRASMLVLTY